LEDARLHTSPSAEAVRNAVCGWRLVVDGERARLRKLTVDLRRSTVSLR
jgi:hypothetical protein